MKKHRTDEKILYSVTFDLSDARTRLEPCVPATAAKEEDRATKRVCLAPTVSQCIAALGPEHRDLRAGRDVIVRKVDVSKLNPDLLVHPRDLFATGRVPDALEHQEYWYLGTVDVVPERFTITDFDYERAIAFSCIAVAQIDTLIKKHDPGNRHRTGESVKTAYERTVRGMQAAGRYEESDEFEDAVAALPFAQALRIHNLRLEKQANMAESEDDEHEQERQK